MRKTKFAPGNYYHIYNRGASQQDIFFSRADYLRFLFIVLHFQAKVPILHTTRLLHKLDKLEEVQLDEEIKAKIVKEKFVELIGFTLMPNHFHLIMYETEEQGISRYMHRILNAYSKFINTKYERTGHVFQGPFGAVHVRSGEQLLYLSAYVHANPLAVTEKENLLHYEWSSFQDYVKTNRWGELLKPEIIIDQYKSGDHYAEYVEQSGAKQAKFDFKTGEHRWDLTTV